MSIAHYDRTPHLGSLCQRAYASDTIHIIGGAIAFLIPRFVGAGAFATMNFGSTSLILQLICLTAALLSLQMPQTHQTPPGNSCTDPHESPQLRGLTPLLFPGICALFILFECGAFAIAANNGYDPSRSWADSPARHIEQVLAASLLITFCCLLLSRNRHVSPIDKAQPSGINSIRSQILCGIALFLAGACLTGLPLLSAYTPFGSLLAPTAFCLFAVMVSLLIALLASSLLWRCRSYSTNAIHLSSFLCGSILINLVQRNVTIALSQPFSFLVCLAAAMTGIAIFALSMCLRSMNIETSPHPNSGTAPTHADPLFEAPFDQLSKRERQVLLLSAKGQSVRSIAQELEIAPTTISTYKSRISKKLQAGWQEIIDCSGIKTNGGKSGTCNLKCSTPAQQKRSDHPRFSSAISLAAGLLFTLLLNTPQPTPFFAELTCIVGTPFLLAFVCAEKLGFESSAREHLLTNYLVPIAVSSLSACAIFHIPDGRTIPLSLDRHLLLFLLVWCAIAGLTRLLSKRTSQTARPVTPDESRMRSYLDAKGVQGTYLEVAVATLKGVSASEIARNLYISTSTVTCYRARIYAKLRVCGREGLFQLLQSELL